MVLVCSRALARRRAEALLQTFSDIQLILPTYLLAQGHINYSQTV